jgi:hypothetical protein
MREWRNAFGINPLQLVNQDQNGGHLCAQGGKLVGWHIQTRQAGDTM